MHNLDYDELGQYISENVVKKFYDTRLDKLEKLQLQRDILSRKNPYLFRAKNVLTSEAFIRGALDAFLSSQEETMLGNLMEDLAIHVCKLVYNGRKAEQGKMKSVDLEFERDGKYHIVSIKSGPDWGNKDQVDRMKTNFKEARGVLNASGITKPIVSVNGCMYGRDANPLKEDTRDPEQTYYKYCGQEFWSLISGDDQLYVRLIEPMGLEAKKRDPFFQELYFRTINMMTLEFGENFLKDGMIDWEKLVEFVSKKDGVQYSQGDVHPLTVRDRTGQTRKKGKQTQLF